MKKLKELITDVSPMKLKSVQILGREDNLTDQLYNIICSGEIKNDEEAMQILYGNSSSKTAYYQVKKKLYSRLVDSLFLIDLSQKKINSYIVAKNYLAKYSGAFEIIRARGAYENQLYLGDKLIKLAVKYNLYQYVIRLTPRMWQLSALIKSDENALEYYHELYIKYRAVESIENLANFYWHRVVYHTSKKRMIINVKLTMEIETYIKEIETKILAEHTCITFLNLSLLKLRILEMQNDHEAIIIMVDDILPQLDNYVDVMPNFYHIILSRKITSLITLRRYADARKSTVLDASYLREGNKTWYTLRENIIVLNFYEEHYKEAYEVYFDTINNESFKLLRESKQEIFKVYRAYFQFFENVGLLEIPKDKVEKLPFRYAKFINDVPIYENDKVGIKITIVVAQFLLLFSEEKYLDAIDKIESVRQYSRAYLRKDATYRSSCFLKMLIKLVECNYHKASTIRKTKTLYAKLKNHPMDVQRQTSHVEIVPFENLWEIILGSIDNSFRGRFKNEKRRSK